MKMVEFFKLNAAKILLKPLFGYLVGKQSLCFIFPFKTFDPNEFKTAELEHSA